MWDNNRYKMGEHRWSGSSDGAEKEWRDHRKKIEPWLSAVLQSEHLSLLAGNGLTKGTLELARVDPPDMDLDIEGEQKPKIDDFAEKRARRAARGDANFEDRLETALTLWRGLQVQSVQEDECPEAVKALKHEIDKALTKYLKSVAVAETKFARRDENQESEDPDETTEEEEVNTEDNESDIDALDALCSFLLTFGYRKASRERLHIFTTNYDRLIEHALDHTGIRVLDRFIGAIEPEFRSSRVDVDMHYNPPGIRGEPRYLEGVVKLTKLHGSLDWRYQEGVLRRVPMAFGGSEDGAGLPERPSETVMIYPNAAKDRETAAYPYAELFRDFSAELCRPQAALVTYGYGFGDDHTNRIIEDMLTIPSTHLVIMSYGDPGGRISRFYESVGHDSQISLLIGNHFCALNELVNRYLPKPAIDPIHIRRTRILENRGEADTDQSAETPEPEGGEDATGLQ